MRRLLRRMALAGVLLGVTFACGPVGAPPPSLSPINIGCPHECADYSSSSTMMTGTGPTVAGAHCSTYQGDQVCVVSEELTYLLVVSVPETEPVNSPGTTFVIKPETAQNVTITLPAVVPAPGVYLADGSDATMVGRNTWNSALGDVFTTLPVHVVFYPQWLLGTQLVDATSIGLPLPPIVADVASPPPWVAGDIYESTSYGVGQTAALGWTATVPSFASGEQYTRVVTVDPPFDDAFPPSIITDVPPKNGPSPNQAEAALAFDDLLGVQQDTTLMQVVLNQPHATLDGWQVYIEVLATGQRVSNLVTLHGAITQAAPKLFTAVAEPMDGTWAIVLKPLDPTLPVSATTILGPKFGITYPTAAPSSAEVVPAHVTGTVRSPLGTPTAATIDFQSVDITLTNTTAVNSLLYETTVTTGASGPGVGQYDVTLPAGNYNVVITPVDPSLAKATQMLTLGAGKTDLTVPAPQTVSGRCIVSDGRALGLATVELTPSIPTPTASQTFAQLQEQLGRPVQTITDANGNFGIAVDEGTYDVTVKPADGSRLPWIVYPSLLVNSARNFTSACYVPAPILENLKVYDLGVNPVEAAIVRAYAVNQNGRYYEIASGFTDSSGETDLFFTALSTASMP